MSHKQANGVFRSATPDGERGEKVARILRRAWIRLRYGIPTAHVTVTAGHCVPAEIEYRARNGRVIGFWAYGSWEPGHPYQGEFEDAYRWGGYNMRLRRGRTECTETANDERNRQYRKLGKL